MKLTECRTAGGILTIGVSGRIDSGNAPQLEEEISKAREAAPSQPVVLDFENLDYMSSAGLRVILRLIRSAKDTSIVNASAEVYSILEMTGFTEMMDVQKAYRVFSVEGCEVIGEGANGKVYRIDGETIVKAYRHPDSLPEIKRERELARTAFVAGVPTAIPYDVVRIKGGGYGSVFELLNATSYAALLQSGEKSVDEVAEMSVALLRLIHSKTVNPGTLPDMKKTALDWAAFLRDCLPRGEAEKLYALIDAVPQDLHILHGDYHIKNIMLQNGESLLIDMDTICCGHPVFELASMYNAYVGFGQLDHSVTLNFLGISFDDASAFWTKSLRLYLETADEEKIRCVEDKARLLGYTRMLRRTIRRGGLDTPEGRAMIGHCKAMISELLLRVDTLLF